MRFFKIKLMQWCSIVSLTITCGCKTAVQNSDLKHEWGAIRIEPSRPLANCQLKNPQRFPKANAFLKNLAKLFAKASPDTFSKEYDINYIPQTIEINTSHKFVKAIALSKTYSKTFEFFR